MRGASRMTDTTVTVPTSRGSGVTDQVALSMPLGTTATSTSGPAILRIGAAATSLTAESTTGHRLQWNRRSSRAKIGAA